MNLRAAVAGKPHARCFFTQNMYLRQ